MKKIKQGILSFIHEHGRSRGLFGLTSTSTYKVQKQKLSLPRRIILGCSVLLLCVGIGFISYSLVSQWLYDRSVEELVEEFDAISDKLREDESEVDLSELRAAMEAYNLEIYENNQEGFSDAWSYQTPSFNLSEWGLSDDAMVGYISIPAMDITLPIYLGASTENMALGAAHLSQTSLPIGGDNVNTVLAAHRGYGALPMFRNIERLSVGDEIYITNFWETLTYRVVETKVILPTDTDEVLIQEGRDLVTLITCHPLGNNTHRYVVYCERVS